MHMGSYQCWWACCYRICIPANFLGLARQCWFFFRFSYWPTSVILISIIVYSIHSELLKAKATSPLPSATQWNFAHVYISLWPWMSNLLDIYGGIGTEWPWPSVIEFILGGNVRGRCSVKWKWPQWWAPFPSTGDWWVEVSGLFHRGNVHLCVIPMYV